MGKLLQTPKSPSQESEGITDCLMSLWTGSRNSHKCMCTAESTFPWVNLRFFPPMVWSSGGSLTVGGEVTAGCVPIAIHRHAAILYAKIAHAIDLLGAHEQRLIHSLHVFCEVCVTLKLQNRFFTAAWEQKNFTRSLQTRGAGLKSYYGQHVKQLQQTPEKLKHFIWNFVQSQLVNNECGSLRLKK